MLEGLGNFLNSLIGALPALYEKYREGQHDERIVELFESYFILGNLLETADELLSLARGREMIEFSRLSENELEEHYSIVQSKVTIQRQRLQRLGDIFLQNPTIDLLDPSIKKDLKSSIGDKENGLFTLGAGLFFNQIFGTGSEAPAGETERQQMERMVEEKYRFISDLTEPEKISVKNQRIVVSDLEEVRKRYREILHEVAEPRHKTLLASKAQQLADQYSVRR
jgi:hypothetical protein|tara:strand:- start:2619 stop:3293 length:675 start_codon:yes stop_codon:yes gene_type:complete